MRTAVHGPLRGPGLRGALGRGGRGRRAGGAAPVYTYATEDLIERAANIATETGGVVHDALFLALAQDAQTVVATADGKLLRLLEKTRYAPLATPLERANDLLL